VTNWTIAFYRDVATAYQPDLINAPYEIYTISGDANETAAGSLGGTTMYDYSVTLPSPFQAVAGSNYWLLIVANEPSIPDWAIALGSGGNGGCFRRTAGMADWWFYRASGDTAFTLLTSDGPTIAITASASPDATGEIIGVGNYPISSLATLTALPAAGYGFVNWTQDGVPVSTSAGYQFTAVSNRTLVANFTPRYSVSVNAAPNYGGQVTGGGTFNSNSIVTVIATPASGYSFVNWTEFGNEVGATIDYSFNIDGPRTLVANFAPSLASATFDFDSGMPPVFPHQGMPASQLNNGVTASFLSLSGGWSVQNDFYYWVPGVFSGNFLYPSTWGSTMAIEFDQPVTNFSLAFFTGDVSSEFDVPTTVRVSAYANSIMSNAVAVATARGDWLTGAYPEGTLSFGSTNPFTKVKIDMPPGQNPPVSYLYFVDNIVVQYVAPPPVTITCNMSPTNGGVVTGEGTFATGTFVTLTAAPNPGYEFVNWTENGSEVCVWAGYDFTATTNRTLVANFLQVPPSYAIGTAALPSNGGTTIGDGIYTNGEPVAVTASPNSGYDFIRWTENGVPISGLDTFTFNAASNRLLVANFALAISPRLDFRVADGALVLSWPTNAIHFALEENQTLGTTNWMSVTNAVTSVGTNNEVTIHPADSSRFYRLAHP
jgi:hypothetical protein